MNTTSVLSWAKASSALPRALRLGALTAAAATLLSACAPVVVGGAMVGSALMASDRRTAGAQVEDEGIELKGNARIRELLTSEAHVNITSYNRMALISGEVPQAQDKATAEKAVRQLEGVTSVVNELAVMPASSLKDRSADAVVTARVKAGILEAKDIQSSAFKVLTERGTVFLMGRVTEREAKRATDVARGIPGVKKVVRVFEILTEDQLANLPNTLKNEPAKK